MSQFVLLLFLNLDSYNWNRLLIEFFPFPFFILNLCSQFSSKVSFSVFRKALNQSSYEVSYHSGGLVLRCRCRVFISFLLRVMYCPLSAQIRLPRSVASAVRYERANMQRNSLPNLGPQFLLKHLGDLELFLFLMPV